MDIMKIMIFWQLIFRYFSNHDGLVKSQNLELLPQLVGIVKVVNTLYIVVTKILPDFLRNYQL